MQVDTESELTEAREQLESVKSKLSETRAELDNSKQECENLRQQLLQSHKLAVAEEDRRRSADFEASRSEERYQHERESRALAQQQLLDEKFYHVVTKAQLLEGNKDVRGVRHELELAKKVENELVSERAATDHARNLLAKSLDRQSEAAEDHAKAYNGVTDKLWSVEKAMERVTTEKQILERQLKDQESSNERIIRGLERQNTVLEDAAAAQAKAVDAYLEHCKNSLALRSPVGAPRTGELVNTFTKCRPSISEKVLQLPPLVIAGGLPPQWSYLSLASAGVLVLDTLDRVSQAIVDSKDAFPAVVTLVVLQGIAWAHLAMKLTPDDIDWAIKPSILLDRVFQLIPSQSVLHNVYQEVNRLIHVDLPIKSWVFNGYGAVKKVDSSNSTLPEGIAMARGHDWFFLARSTGSGEHLFVTETQALVIEHPRIGYAFMRLPHIDGLPAQHRCLELVTGIEHSETYDWLQEKH